MLSCGDFTFALLDLSHIYYPNMLKLGVAVNKGSINEFIKVLNQILHVILKIYKLGLFSFQALLSIAYNDDFPSQTY